MSSTRSLVEIQQEQADQLKDTNKVDQTKVHNPSLKGPFKCYQCSHRPSKPSRTHKLQNVFSRVLQNPLISPPKLSYLIVLFFIYFVFCHYAASRFPFSYFALVKPINRGCVFQPQSVSLAQAAVWSGAAPSDQSNWAGSWDSAWAKQNTAGFWEEVPVTSSKKKASKPSATNKSVICTLINFSHTVKCIHVMNLTKICGKGQIESNSPYVWL